MATTEVTGHLFCVTNICYLKEVQSGFLNIKGRVPDEARILVLCPKWPDFSQNFGVRPDFYDYSQNFLYLGQKMARKNTKICKFS